MVNLSFASFLFLALCGVAGDSEEAIPTDPVEFLAAAVLSQEKQFEAIGTLRFEMNEHWLKDKREGLVEWKNTHKHWMSGKSLKIARLEQKGLVDQKPDYKAETTLVLNPEYMGQHVTGTANVSIREIASIDKLPDRIKESIAFCLPADPWKVAWGNGINTYEQMLNSALRGGEIKYSVREDSAVPNLRVLSCTQGDLTIFEVTVDPAKSYSTVAIRINDEVGRLMTEYVVVPREFVPGFWFPEKWTRKRWWYDDPSEVPLFDSEYTAQVTDFHGGEDLDADLFTWKSLPFHKEAHFLRETLSGGVDHMQVMDGELVPVAIKREFTQQKPE